MSRAGLLVILITAAGLAAAFLVPAMPQPLAYHDFADRRAILGIANFLDVATNLGFLLAGIAGIVVVLSRRTVFERPAERWPYAIFFLGLMLTAAGSGYYHLAPDNERLFWDRLPMTVAFMSLIAAQVVDRISVRGGLALLAPMLLVGAASVVYWLATERAGAGNVIPYGLLQGYAVLMLLLLAVLYRSRYTRGADIYWVFGAYLAAKLFGRLPGGEAVRDVRRRAAAARRRRERAFAQAPRGGVCRSHHVPHALAAGARSGGYRGASGSDGSRSTSSAACRFRFDSLTTRVLIGRMVSMRQRTPPMPPLARRTVTLSKPALTRPIWWEIVMVEAKARSGQRGKNSSR